MGDLKSCTTSKSAGRPASELQALNLQIVPSLYIYNQQIERTNQTKFLGYILDERITWASHISYTKAKAAKNIGILANLKTLLNTQTLLMLYYTFIHPYFLNGISTWETQIKMRLTNSVKFRNVQYVELPTPTTESIH